MRRGLILAVVASVLALVVLVLWLHLQASLLVRTVPLDGQASMLLLDDTSDAVLVPVAGPSGGQLYTLDGASGTVRRRDPVPGLGSSRLYADGTGYIIGTSGNGTFEHLFAIDPGAGRIRAIAGSVNTVALSSLDGSPLVAVDRRRQRLFVVANAPTPGLAPVVTTPEFNSGPAAELVTYDLGDDRRLRTEWVGQSPIALAVDARLGRVLVLNNSNSLSILDAQRGRLLQTVPVGLFPTSLAVDAANDKAFAVAGDGTLSIVDLRRSRLLRTTGLVANPQLVAVDQRAGRIFIASAGMRPNGGAIQVFDAGSGRRLSMSASGFPRVMATDDAHGYLVLAADGPTTGGTITMLNSSSGKVVRTVAESGNPGSILVNAHADRVFVGVLGPWHTDLPARVGLVASAAPAGGRIGYVGDGSVVVLTASGGRPLCTVPVGVSPGSMVLDNRTHRLFVLNAGGNAQEPDPWGWLPGPLHRLLPRPAPADSGSSVSVIDLASCT